MKLSRKIKNAWRKQTNGKISLKKFAKSSDAPEIDGAGGKPTSVGSEWINNKKWGDRDI